MTSPSKPALTPPDTYERRGWSSVSDMPRLPLPAGVSEVAELFPVALTAISAPGAVICALAPTIASTSAVLVTSANAEETWPLKRIDSLITADEASARFAPLAVMSIEAAPPMSESKNASTPPPTFAVGMLTPTLTSPPPTASDSATARVGAGRGDVTAPVTVIEPLPPVTASTSASPVTSASAPPPSIPTTLIWPKKVSAFASFPPTATISKPEAPITSPSENALTPPAILACAYMMPALKVPVATPCESA